MDLALIVSVNFLPQDHSHFLHFGDLLQGTGAHNSILDPAVRSFDLAFGLRREGIDDVDPQAVHHLAPLSVDIIGLKDMVTPEAIPSLHETEDTQGVDVIAQRHAKSLHDGPGIVISASGMCTAGRILHHLKRRLPHKENAVLFVGFQGYGTRGRLLLDGAPSVRTHGDEVPVAARIFQLHAMSAHADRDDLIRWFSGLEPGPDRLFLVHGEPDATDSLAKLIRSKAHARVEVPTKMETIGLDE